MMDRRAFTRTLAGTALGAAVIPKAPRAAAQPSTPQGEAAGVPFRLSVMLWTVFQNLPFEARLEKVAAAGYHAVQLVGEFAHWSDEDYRRFNRQKRSLGISFDTTAGLEHAVGNPSEREALLADIRHMLGVMEKLECPSLIVMSGDVVPGMSREAQHRSCVEGLKRAAEVVQGKGLTLLLENIDPEENPKYFLTSVAEGFNIVGEVNHPQVKFLYDFFHEQIAEGNLIEKLEKNVEKVGVVHVADVPGRHEPGTGEINYTNIYKKLAALHYDRYIAMEFLPTGDPVESLRAAREMALRAATR
jgi:hydroxypyruvate isomerase